MALLASDGSKRVLPVSSHEHRPELLQEFHLGHEDQLHPNTRGEAGHDTTAMREGNGRMVGALPRPTERRRPFNRAAKSGGREIKGTLIHHSLGRVNLEMKFQLSGSQVQGGGHVPLGRGNGTATRLRRMEVLVRTQEGTREGHIQAIPLPGPALPCPVLAFVVCHILLHFLRFYLSLV